MTSNAQTISINTKTALAGQADETAVLTTKKQRPLLTRDELADEMMRCCDDDIAKTAHQAAAEAIRRGDEREKVFGLLDFVAYPGIYIYVLFEMVRFD